jgi:hypothetical protein
MRNLTWVLLGAICMTGCAPVKTDYSGSVKTNTVNGSVQSVELRFPGCQSSTTVGNPDDLDRAIAQTESMLISMKEARKQLGGNNPAPQPKQ